VAGETAGTIFTLLIAAGIVGVVWARWFAPAHLRRDVADASLALASLVAVGAMLGSLYFSEVENFIPCEMCWFQRIAMYPLAVILPIAALRRDQGIRPYAIALAGIGALISMYHIQLQLFPGQASSCDPDTPCTFKWLDIFGFVSIPWLALGSFTLILLLTTMPPGRREADSHFTSTETGAETGATDRQPEEVL
jgi:disulfide bond formation protein DsbB